MGVQYGDRTGLCELLISQKDSDMMTQLQGLAAYGVSKGINYYQYDAVTLSDINIDINKNLR